MARQVLILAILGILVLLMAGCGGSEPAGSDTMEDNMAEEPDNMDTVDDSTMEDDASEIEDDSDTMDEEDTSEVESEEESEEEMPEEEEEVDVSELEPNNLAIVHYYLSYNGRLYDDVLPAKGNKIYDGLRVRVAFVSTNGYVIFEVDDIELKPVKVDQDVTHNGAILFVKEVLNR
ncbi:hypothetical protein JW868_02285 [Candidatus Woesearchaeota archaeon]|nr:hypothetical protein [Candidatus Woesearchaeota archaeon]